jgi:aminoglycoside 3-N-acetyltransferase
MKMISRPRGACTLSSLKTGLKRLGFVPGDAVIVHASLKSLGWVKGGPATVVRALQETVTKRGTVLMPTFSFSFDRVYEPGEPYDPKRSPSKVGLLTETFRKMKGVRRSGHPTHSVAVWGKDADKFMDGHELHSAFAPGTPLERAARKGAKLLLIGCDFRALSLLHVAEELAPSPYLSIFNWAGEGWKSAALVVRKDGPAHVEYDSVPGCSRSFHVAQELALKQGLLGKGVLGDAPVLTGSAGMVLDMAVAQLRKRPDWLLCPAAACRACDDRRSVFDCEKSPGAAFIGKFMIEVVAKAGIRQAGSEGEEPVTGLPSWVGPRQAAITQAASAAARCGMRKCSALPLARKMHALPSPSRRIRKSCAPPRRQSKLSGIRSHNRTRRRCGLMHSLPPGAPVRQRPLGPVAATNAPPRFV